MARSAAGQPDTVAKVASRQHNPAWARKLASDTDNRARGFGEQLA
jgi:hypothetical protein